MPKTTLKGDVYVTMPDELGSGGGGSSVTVVDNLNSTSATSALSAKQGKVLNESKLAKATPTTEQGTKEYIYSFAGETQNTDLALVNDMGNGASSYTDKMVPTAKSVATVLDTIKSGAALVVQFTVSGSTVSCDKTVAEISTAAMAGQPVFGYYLSNEDLMLFTLADVGLGIVFICTVAYSGIVLMFQGYSDDGVDSWTYVEKQGFTGATESRAGRGGFVPAPSAGDNTKFLRGDGTWGQGMRPVTGHTDEIAVLTSTGQAASSGKKVADLTVSPNQSDTPTQTLQRLKIGDVQFKLGGAAYAADSYSALVTTLNSLAAESYEIGQSIFIKTLNVPDLWIYANNETSVAYTYVSDAQFLSDMEAAGGVLQIGAYKVSQLETEKVDITNCIKYDAQSLTDGQKAQARTNIGAAPAASVKSALDETLVDGVEYRIGSVSELALTLPASGVYGIHIVFTASAAFTPAVTGTVVGETIEATVSGKTYEWLLTWNGSAWVLSTLCY